MLFYNFVCFPVQANVAAPQSLNYTQSHRQCCGAGPFLTGSGSEYFFHLLRLRLRLQLLSKEGFQVLSKVEPGAGTLHWLRVQPKSTGSDRVRLRNTGPRTRIVGHSGVVFLKYYISIYIYLFKWKSNGIFKTLVDTLYLYLVALTGRWRFSCRLCCTMGTAPPSTSWIQQVGQPASSMYNQG